MKKLVLITVILAFAANTFAEIQGGKFWNGFAIGVAGFLGNELGEYIRKKGAERRYMENELGLTKEEIQRLKNYGLKAIKTNEYADDISHSLWNKLKSYQIVDDTELPFSLRAKDFDPNAIIKAGKLHIRNSTDIMIGKHAYRLNLETNGLIPEQYFNIHYDHFDVIMFPVLHLLFDSVYQGVLGVK
ncbi:MAG: hypothetical protein LBP63_08940 [Prevotellaceae bacterium]|nr:hypothetical protein [Prevotellaceae bacterium]